MSIQSISNYTQMSEHQFIQMKKPEFIKKNYKTT
jgi:hypothetical protein